MGNWSAEHQQGHEVAVYMEEAGTRRTFRKRTVALPTRLGSSGIQVPEGHGRHSCPDRVPMEHIATLVSDVGCAQLLHQYLTAAAWEVCPSAGTPLLNDKNFERRSLRRPREYKGETKTAVGYYGNSTLLFLGQV
ncbi:hypothetical protein BTVI_104061 [Pitangus sulphuratus]|nr:hypothetical protein BTVI_104061 [Pitangus sulphuratus]